MREFLRGVGSRQYIGRVVVYPLVIVVWVCSGLDSGSLVSPAHAQGDFELAATYFEHSVAAGVSDRSDLDAFSSNRWSIAGLVPVVINEKLVYLAAPRYMVWRFAVEDGGSLTIHSLALSQTVRRVINPRWSVLGTVVVGLASDFNDVDLGHVRFGGGVVAQRRINPRLELGAGLLANYSFGEFLPLPVLAATWRASDKLQVRAFLPARMRVSYRVAPRVVIGVELGVEGNQFSIQQGGLAQDLDVESLALSEASVRLRAAVNLVGPLWATVYGGHSVFRRLQIFDSDEAELSDLTPELSPLFGIALQVVPPPRPKAR